MSQAATDALVSVFANAFATKTQSNISVSDVLESIRLGAFQSEVESLRQVYGSDKEKYDLQKKKLHAITFSGTFSSRRKPAAKKLQIHSNILLADLDKLSSDKLAEVRQGVTSDPHVCFVFASPSGHGLKVGIRIDGDRHAESFVAAQAHFKSVHGVEIDESCKDVSRLCFISYDPDVWVNQSPAVLPIPAPVHVDLPVRRSAQTQAGELRQTSLGKTARHTSLGDLPVGAPLCNCSGGVGVVERVVGSSLSEKSRAEICRAVEFGLNATRQNNRAAYHAVQELIRIRDVESVADMRSADRTYFAEQWYQALRAAGRITAGKFKSHYFADIFDSIKNAHRKDSMNNDPLREAWSLAQTQPLPPEAATFGDDPKLQRFIALCYQMHLKHEKGSWFLARDRTGRTMGLSSTDTRNWLGESFNVLVGCGILEVVTPYDEVKKRATEYRYVERAAEVVQ